MKGIRWFFSIPFILVLFVLIIAGITSTSISRTLTNPSSLKGWLKKGDIYNKLPLLIPEFIASQSGSGELSQMPLDQNDLAKISIAVLEPNWTQDNIEKIIDAGYLFLEGETKIPNFKVDISSRKEILVNEISSQLGGQMGSRMKQQLRNELEKNELLSQGTINSSELIKIESKEVNKIQTFLAIYKKYLIT
jgi:hypothetical protein